MELRIIVAYALIAILVAGALVLYLHLTRERRQMRRAYGRYRARWHQRIEEAAQAEASTNPL